MSSYRFCRTDDIGLLVDALNHCWAPHVPGEPLATPESFKRSIRDLQVWCSSCMVAFANGEPIGVLIGAKRAGATLVHRIAVHPDHQRQGHARHMLGSLASKLAILGPRHMVAEIPESSAGACDLFSAGGYVEKARLTDYVLDGECEGASEELGVGRFVIPVTVDDLVANGLLGSADQETCWQRSSETLIARKAGIAGFAVATGERLEACILYSKDGEVLLLRSFFGDGGAGVRQLVSRLRAHGIAAWRFARVSPDEIPAGWLEAAGFRADGECRRYAADARGD